ncbi:MAG: capsular polysaccharide biosynthesis protein [Pseudomonadota bacterium]
MLYTLSPALAALPNLRQFLADEVRLGLPLLRDGNARLVGWGRKPSFHWAARYARLRGLPCLSLEDGFLRSVGIGRDAPPLSLIVDDLGIYYDATAPSRLEALTAAGELDAQQAQRARDLIAAWRAGRVSKYNRSRDWDEGMGELPPRFVLAVDQTFGDASIRFGMADESSFRRMLQAALDEHPDKDIVLKVHPEVFAGRKRGHFDRLSPGESARVKVLGRDVHAPSLLERAEAVYVVSSQMGFEGLLWGKPVRTFGMPFYAGWGLTGDELPAPSRRRDVSLEKLAHAALVEYPRYVDPETGRACEAERVLDYLGFQRRMRQRYPATVHAIGFGPLRRPMARAFFAGSDLQYHDDLATVPAGATIAVWGRDACRDDLPAGMAQVCLEDGFLRSVGLGAELARPLSLVMDGQGIYYDATRACELEEILQNGEFDPALLQRAANLRRRIVESGLTKYNVGAGAWSRPPHASRVILVPGQVEVDASIRYGSPLIKTNLELLKAVRVANPDAWVVYKPHPDVEAGLRASGRGEHTAADHCDEIVRDIPINVLMESVDELHVLTSLAGFEALLRNRRVVVYGQPFYAGWGLTEDVHPPARRTRRLSLDELVAGTLILYPAYVSRTTGAYTTPERALEELLAWREAAAKPASPAARLKRRLKRAAIAAHNRLELLFRSR